MQVHLIMAGEGQALSGLDVGKVGALFAYLAGEADRPHTRQALAELLWPERSDAEALSSLRFALSKLHTALQDRQMPQPFLWVSRSQVQLNPQADIWVDIAEFQRQASKICGGAPVQAAALQATLALYRGNFLQGFGLGDSLPFENWALNKRDQLERQRMQLLERLAQRLEAEGQYPQAEATYRCILAERPWDEATYRYLMRLLAATGQPGAAIAQYEACCLALRELGIAPGAETNRLLYQIRQNMPTGVLTCTEPEQDTPETAFVAREREMQRLGAFLERSLTGQTQVALIAGEAGSGKTALLGQFARQALTSHPSLLVVGGQSDAYTGSGQPYQPFVECVQMLAGAWETLPWAEHLPAEARARLQAALPQTAQTLVESAPALLGRFVNRADLGRSVRAAAPDLRPRPAWLKTLSDSTAHTVPRLEAGLLFEQLTRFLIEISYRQPLVLVLDDLHWIDPGSAALAFHLVRHLSTSRILILAAYRPVDLHHLAASGEHSLTGLVSEIRRYGGWRGGSMRLDLDQANEQDFVAALLEQDPQLQPNALDEAFRATLAHRTGGNPLFTVELLRSMQARGDLVRSDDGVWESRPDLDWDHLPERVEAAITGRIFPLNALWRDWLSTASVMGESFSAEVLAKAHGVPEHDLLQALNGPLGMGRGALHLIQGEGVQWVQAEDRRPRSLSHYRFRHILFQTYLYQQLNPVERSRRHSAVATALEAFYAGQFQTLARPAAELARHFEAGGMPEKAARYHLQAGQQAVYLASGQVAVNHYRHALDLLNGLPNSPELNHLEISLYLALGAPFLLAEGWGGPERQQAIEKALARIETMDRDAAWPELFPALYAQADWLTSQGKHAQAIHMGEQILILTGEQPGLPQILGHRILSSNHLFQGQFAEARRRLEQLLDMCNAGGHPKTLTVAGVDIESISRTSLGFVLTLCGSPAQGWAQAVRGLARARSVNHLPTLGSALIFAGESAVLSGDWPTLQTLAGELLECGQAREQLFFRAHGLGNRGYARVLQAQTAGEYAVQQLALTGLDEIRQGWRLWKTTGTRTGRGQWIVRLAHACLLAGKIDEGLEFTTNALRSDKTGDIAVGLAQIYQLQGELLLKSTTPQRSAAEVCFGRALEIARQQGALLIELRVALCLARLWQSEHPGEARALLCGVTSGFSEGLETPDGLEAQTLLKQLGRV